MHSSAKFLRTVWRSTFHSTTDLLRNTNEGDNHSLVGIHPLTICLTICDPEGIHIPRSTYSCSFPDSLSLPNRSFSSFFFPAFSFLSSSSSLSDTIFFFLFSDFSEAASLSESSTSERSRAFFAAANRNQHYYMTSGTLKELFSQIWFGEEESWGSFLHKITVTS